MWRQGDVLFAAVEQVPEKAGRLNHCVLAEGEATGHYHRVGEDGAAELYEWGGSLYLRILAEWATVVHDEHHPITLKRGVYRVWRQREYTPAEVRYVSD